MKITIDATPMELFEFVSLLEEEEDFDECEDCDECLHVEVTFDDEENEDDEEEDDEEPEFSKDQIMAARVAARMILDDFFKNFD